MPGSGGRSGDPVLVVTTGRSLDSVLRAVSLALELDRSGVGARILTVHPRAQEIERLTGRNLIWFPEAAWNRAAPRYLAMATPRLVVIDGFPFGRSGEFLTLPASRGEPPTLVHLAVKIPFEEYLGAIGARWDRDGTRFERVIRVGPLDPGHESALTASRVVAVADAFRLPPDRVPDSPALRELLGPGSPWAVAGPSGTPVAAAALEELLSARSGGGS